MVGKIKIGDFTLVSVFKHRFEKEKNYLRPEFRGWTLGVWFEKSMIVGKKRFSDPQRWKEGLTHSYTVGVNLLVCKFWIAWDFGGMHLEEK